MLSGTKEPDEITPEENEMVQNLINETYDKFKSVVAEGRKPLIRATIIRAKSLSRTGRIMPMAASSPASRLKAWFRG